MVKKTIAFIISFLLLGNSYSAVSCEGKKIHLTFDDGPNPSTTIPILRILEQNDIY